MSAANTPIGSEYEVRLPTDRRRVLVALARASANAAALTVLYALLPLEEPVGRATIGWLAVGLLAFVVLVVLQLRSILRARHPGLRAIEALGATVPMFVLVFASTYLLLSSGQPRAFTEALSHTDALYFTMTVFSTVGFGDIAPQSDAARMVVTAQMVGNLIVLGALARVVVGAVRLGRQRQAAEATPTRQTQADMDVTMRSGTDDPPGVDARGGGR